MKEVFRHQEVIHLSIYQDLLEAAGIPSLIRHKNEALSGISEMPFHEFSPNLCVINDEDEEKARQIIENSQKTDTILERSCPACREPNPGNFDLCYACQEPLTELKPC